MGASDILEKELPFLRRYARAVSGSGQRGDTLVEETIADLIDSGEKVIDRVSVFAILDKRCRALEPRSDTDCIAQLSSDARRALLLTAMEGFPVADVAAIMNTNTSTISELIAEAESDLKASLATTVFIMEDEPIVAAHLAQIAEQMGHRVCGQAVTRGAAVAGCLEQLPGLLLADVQLADGSSGAEAAADITRELDIPVVFITAYPQRLLMGQSGEPAFLIPKPFRPDMVKAVISQALIQRSARSDMK